MSPIQRFILFAIALMTVLNGCVTSSEKQESTKAPQTSQAYVGYTHQAPIMMQQPERHLLHSVSNFHTLDSHHTIGLLGKDIQKMFGVPDFKRYDLLAEIWQYRKKNCLLDFFLYAEKQQSNDMRVRHAEARGRSIYKISQKNCFHQALLVKS